MSAVPQHWSPLSVVQEDGWCKNAYEVVIYDHLAAAGGERGQNSEARYVHA